MKSSQNILRKSNEDLIGEDLEKLFSFQDKHLSKDKKTILVSALLESKIPVGAIILGLRYLMNDDLVSIKMGTLLHAARMHIEPVASDACGDCSEGFVIMRDTEGRWFTIACRCGLGMIKKQTGLALWKGETSQYVNGKIIYKQKHGIGN